MRKCGRVFTTYVKRNDDGTIGGAYPKTLKNLMNSFWIQWDRESKPYHTLFRLHLIQCEFNMDVPIEFLFKLFWWNPENSTQGVLNPQVCPSVHNWRSLWTIDESHSGTQLGRKAQTKTKRNVWQSSFFSILKRLINNQWDFVWILSHHFLQCPSAGICKGGSSCGTLDYQKHKNTLDFCNAGYIHVYAPLRYTV